MRDRYHSYRGAGEVRRIGAITPEAASAALRANITSDINRYFDDAMGKPEERLSSKLSSARRTKRSYVRVSTPRIPPEDDSAANHATYYRNRRRIVRGIIRMASTMFDTIMARMDAGTLDDQTPAPAARVAPTGSDVVQNATSGLG